MKNQVREKDPVDKKGASLSSVDVQ